jgi:hypothetical protein
MSFSKLKTALNFLVLKRGKFITIAVLSTLILLVSSEKSLARTLRTENYTVTITRNCRSESVTCNDVTYEGVSNTGESIRLTGQTVHTWYMERGQRVPNRFVGYIFSSGDYTYFVDQVGRLTVYQGETVLLDEPGDWLRPDP